VADVGFSSAYLNHSEEVSVYPGIGFHIVVLKPGLTHRWQANKEKLRLCSIASGKVQVRIEGSADFHLGPNGMFTINPGVACVVNNRQYVDATIHVCVVED
jgi:hypothetical protein